MKFITRLRRDRVAEVLNIHEQNERLLLAQDRILLESICSDLMAIVLETCKVCTFWDNDADRAGFVPCLVHAPLFGEVAR